MLGVSPVDQDRDDPREFHGNNEEVLLFHGSILGHGSVEFQAQILGLSSAVAEMMAALAPAGVIQAIILK